MNPLIGTIMLFAGNFAPRTWAFCDGALIAISSNTALFSILGTTYGGDGRTTFALPDLRGRTPIGPRRGPGLSDYNLGERGGLEEVTLTSQTLPYHSHLATLNNGSAGLKINTGDGTTNDPVGNFLAKGVTPPNPPIGAGTANIYATTANSVMPGDLTGTITVSNTGGSQPHNNMQPYIAVNYIIAMFGVYPSRS